MNRATVNNQTRPLDADGYMLTGVYTWTAYWGDAWSERTGTESEVMAQIKLEAEMAYPDPYSTHLVKVVLVANEKQDDEIWGGGILQLEPNEPECSNLKGHDWENGRPSNSLNGGVKYTDTCCHCGLRRHTATRYDTPVHPHVYFTKVSYEPADYWLET